MYHHIFIHSSVDEHLGCFHDLAIVLLAIAVLQWTLGCVWVFELWFSLGICPVVGLLGHMVILFLVFWGTSILFSIVTVPIYIPINSVGRFQKEIIFRKDLSHSKGPEQTSTEMTAKTLSFHGKRKIFLNLVCQILFKNFFMMGVNAQNSTMTLH